MSESPDNVISLSTRALRSLGRTERDSEGPVDAPLTSGPDVTNISGMAEITREELDAKFEALLARTDGRIETAVARFEGKVETSAMEMKKDIAESKSDIIKWLAGTVFAAAAIIISVMAFMLNRALPQPAQQQPIVIQVPSQATPAPLAAPPRKP